ncbi:alpha amylase catalytic region [Chloroherpeton thalassium ATCC 35110]|uniref:Alpha amylase catalytic region n=1 Tax=Chloroherpeton thalassium (strain ATCC 35110 / GB-78) TaxID=517418 RepID=B3QT64_CHLT3|nr:alpha-amylase family glycosyl hydrolase [Chloroherpeton thalassium]ACF14163.1 alpha amylase catalytic region [Chloroherpeton thalassium ATCC 35110]
MTYRSSKHPKKADFLFAKKDFHIVKTARDEYELEEEFFSVQGSLLIGDYKKAQEFAKKINNRRAVLQDPKRPAVLPAQLHAMALLHEIFHFVIDLYVKRVNPTAFSKCNQVLLNQLGQSNYEPFLERFVESFPPLSVYKQETTPKAFLAGINAGIANRELELEELILVWLQNQNPALKPVKELIDDSQLKKSEVYPKSIIAIDAFFDAQPTFGPDFLPLVKMLLAPILAAPTSLLDQLQFILSNWGELLKETPFLASLMQATEFIKEEDHYFWMKLQADADRQKQPDVKPAFFGGWFEKETPPVPDYNFMPEGPERFSPDLNWMPKVVLLAKSTFVWLDQLSKKYKRPIQRLDDIPDQELDIIARSGFTGLWLIGIWQRSKASKKIKHINGNIDAVASAYSLNHYDIAEDLGGPVAYENLRDRAKRRGLRLASDMVPNHTALDSDWVINHPDWFLQTDHPPYPTYTYNGPDLSENDRVGIFIEDGYWSKTDAAVTFKRLDRWTGDTKYIYHGNDGTAMPWNDTAQLNFLNPEVREAVIQEILHVARMFPIIRFDAAMVLAKQHIQRLWFPRPGKSGAVPSRWAYAMTDEEFDAAIPEEFWREVVERVQREVPNTLLLAEAFWMLEGYFVRTLGMHRVYNSAFMHMFKKEENSSYRYLIKNTLEYNPQILKRYVNFMNNPDEETAVAQFGKGDKYFGVCVMMATMPGLPMFGHGQIEGFTEKYGMEYKRAYYNEEPDHYLVSRHEREIFPVLKKRFLFAEVENFFLYDFYVESGAVDENVFAFSNCYGNEKALVIYHNKYGQTSGWIKTSVGYLENGQIVQKSLADGLGISNNANTYTVFRDHISGMEFIRKNTDIHEKGIFADLHAYKYHIFWDFREVCPSKIKPYDELYKMLNGSGVPSIDEAVLELTLQTVHAAFREMIDPEHLKKCKNGWYQTAVKKAALTPFKAKIKGFIRSVKELETGHKIPEVSVLKSAEADFSAIMTLVYKLAANSKASDGWQALIKTLLSDSDSGDLSGWKIILGWATLRHLNEICTLHNEPEFNLLCDWHLDKFLRQSLIHVSTDNHDAEVSLKLLVIALELQRLLDKGVSSVKISAQLRILAKNRHVQQFLQINFWDDHYWLNKEQLEMVCNWLFMFGAADTVRTKTEKTVTKQLSELFAAKEEILSNAEQAGYDFEKFIALLDNSELSVLEKAEANISEEQKAKDSSSATKKTTKRKTTTKSASDSKTKTAKRKKKSDE